MSFDSHDKKYKKLINQVLKRRDKKCDSRINFHKLNLNLLFKLRAETAKETFSVTWMGTKEYYFLRLLREKFNNLKILSTYRSVHSSLLDGVKAFMLRQCWESKTILEFIP